MSNELNRILDENEDEEESFQSMVNSEVLKFEPLNGFLNIYLQNE